MGFLLRTYIVNINIINIADYTNKNIWNIKAGAAIGIAISVLWVVIATSFFAYHVNDEWAKGENPLVTQEYVNLDLYLPSLPYDDEKVIEEKDLQPIKIVETINYNFFIQYTLLAIIPIALAWAAFYLSVWVITWILAGFK